MYMLRNPELSRQRLLGKMASLDIVVTRSGSGVVWISYCFTTCQGTRSRMPRRFRENGNGRKFGTRARQLRSHRIVGPGRNQRSNLAPLAPLQGAVDPDNSSNIVLQFALPRRNWTGRGICPRIFPSLWNKLACHPREFTHPANFLTFLRGKRETNTDTSTVVECLFMLTNYTLDIYVGEFFVKVSR